MVKSLILGKRENRSLLKKEHGNSEAEAFFTGMTFCEEMRGVSRSCLRGQVLSISTKPEALAAKCVGKV